MDPAPAVTLSDVYFAYDEVPVLEGVTTTIATGDFVGIVGPNGGGKTTLLKLMLGLLQPARGQVRLLGEMPAKVRRRVGYVPQQFDATRHFPATVMDVVTMGR